MTITELVQQVFACKALTQNVETKINEMMWHCRFTPNDLEALDQLTAALQNGEIAVIENRNVPFAA